ncbi:hypothetical protein RhiirC2_727236 [Rhizophagus irregularis]|uniref:BTB-domain-containing protein n=1 Tax=Rhizophagus irregularis TaxID=588596 RepID=A0A2N1NZW8_9GLOM|nr:hypothetical protein RhiirC2_727236 [Rhizophagus irregularis]
MQPNPAEAFLLKDIRTLVNNTLFSDIKIKGNDGKEINAHRVILAVRSEVFKRMLLNGMKESSQEVIEFPEFSSDVLHVIIEYLYAGKVTEHTLTIEMVAEAFHSADYFLLEQLKLQIIEFFNNHLRNNTENKLNLSAKVLSRLLECMESSDNEFIDLLCDSINSVSLKSIEYCNLTVNALEYCLSNVKRKEIMMFSLSEYELFHYIILWAASGISEEALSFYKSCLPSSETVKSLDRNSNPLIYIHNIQGHAKYQSMMLTKTSPLLNLVKLERIHPFIISNIIEPLNGLIDSKTLIDVYRKQALFAGKSAYFDCVSFQWDDKAHGSNIYLNNTSLITSNSSSHEWIRTTIPISRQSSIFEWNIMVEEMCSCFWVGICTEKGFNVEYNSWLGKQAYGWVFGSNGVICHNTQQENGPYTNKYGKEFKENDRITVHLDMGKRTCSFSINGKRYPIAFRDLPDEIYPAVSLKAPGRARIEPHQYNSIK